MIVWSNGTRESQPRVLRSSTAPDRSAGDESGHPIIIRIALISMITFALCALLISILIAVPSMAIVPLIGG